MAEAFVSFVIERLGNTLVQEASSFKGAHGQFQRLRKELISINEFLRAADMKRCDDPGILMWVADIRDIAYDVDDIIDSFILKVSSKRRMAEVHKKILNSCKIRKEIKSLFGRIEEIDKRRQRYGITIPLGRSDDDASSSTSNDTTISYGRNDDASSSTSNAIRLRRSYPGAEEDNIIGLEEESNNLVEELMKEGEQRRVVSICGMGGLGKTTLAKRVYNHNGIKSHFDCHAWTLISQQCRVGDVAQEILRQVTNVSGDVRGNMSEAEMMDKLSTILEEKRYLVVLDDVWNKEAWDMLKSAFPHGRNGSKVMLTTRNVDVACYADQWGYDFEPRKMNEDVAWDLILKIASQDDFSRSRHVSSDMEICGRDIVKRCGGLPLAIILLGGILATKKTLSQWETVSKDIDQARVSTVLALSYNDLPFHMKPLFLYLGLYPEDYQIPIKDVIKMWIAEGMVLSKQGSQVTMEEAGNQYVEEMIQRSMIQVGSRKKSGGVKTCKLHDMMRDLSILKASEENFFQTIGNDMVPPDGSPSLSTATCNLRRCAIYLGKERYAFSKHIVPRIRTVIFFQGPTFDDSSSSDYSSSSGNSRSSVEIAYEDFKQLRVLDIQKDWADVSVLCAQVLGKLTNLRYLGLSGCCVKELPKSIGNLIFLETLDVRGWGTHLPNNVIWKMSRLRHLYMDWLTEITDYSLRLYLPLNH